MRLKKMNKSELIDALSAKTELTKTDISKTLNGFVEIVTNELSKGNEIQLVGFGTFKINKREARKGRNPSTGASIDIAASNVPSFKVGKSLKDACN